MGGILANAGSVFAAFDGINRFYVPADRDDLRAVLEAPVTVLDGWETHRQMGGGQAAERLQGSSSGSNPISRPRAGAAVCVAIIGEGIARSASAEADAQPRLSRLTGVS